jgi:prolyl 4-hydroxylase
MHSFLSSVSFVSAIQYAFFGIVLYVLAGAPLSSFISDASTSSSHSRGGEKLNLEHLVIPDPHLVCPAFAFNGVYILHRDPLVLYIEGFVSELEARHVVNIRFLSPSPPPISSLTHKPSTPAFTPSTIWTGTSETLDPSIRLSSKALLPRDAIVQCIEARARSFQGFRPHVYVEKMWAQKYGPGGHYSYHYDWGVARRGVGRVSSFMVYLESEGVKGGGTHFPRLTHPGKNDELCKFIDCDGVREGVTFKPVAGNAVYWENMRQDGSGYAESWHAGLPVEEGKKIGLNIWSWMQEGWEPVG